MSLLSLDQAAIRHGIWDIGAWLSAVALLVMLYRTRPALFGQGSLARVQRGYFLALSFGSLLGAYLIGSANVWLSGQPGVARSILGGRSEEHTSELQSLMRISYAVFCLKKKKQP